MFVSRNDAETRTIARQHAMTARLMGIDFLPVRLEVASESLEVGLPGAAATPPAILPVETSSAVSIQRRPKGLTADREAAGSDAKRRLLKDLHERHDATCPHCSTIDNYTQTVFGEGDPDARLMFIGEAPGEDEDRTGRPFVGKAGQKLTEIILAMGLQREAVYIANVLKARPPENRTPLPDEVAKCSPFLEAQIAIIRPSVIVALGGPASKLLLRTEIGITRLRGQWGTYSQAEMRIPIMPTFHPAYLLRNYTKETRKQVWSDMQAVLERLRQGDGR